jgi:hypothetical protein
MLKNSLIVLGLLTFVSCSINLLPEIAPPKKIVLSLQVGDSQDPPKNLSNISPIYLSGVYVSEPYRSTKIYSCKSTDSSGFEWLGSIESQLESEFDRAFRTAFPSASFVSKESGSYSKSDLSFKVYRICLDKSEGELELKVSVLASLRTNGTSDENTHVFNFSYKKKSSEDISDFLSEGMGVLFGDVVSWLVG